jgi:hypothetical protein
MAIPPEPCGQGKDSSLPKKPTALAETPTTHLAAETRFWRLIVCGTQTAVTRLISGIRRTYAVDFVCRTSVFLVHRAGHFLDAEWLHSSVAPHGWRRRADRDDSKAPVDQLSWPVDLIAVIAATLRSQPFLPGALT